VWQEIRAELHPRGLEVVTVGLDTAGPEACRPFIEAARPEHPSLIDVGHLMAERFGVVNIPNAIWIDEAGIIVRPAEPAHPGEPSRPSAPGQLPERMRAIFAEANKIRRTDPGRYRAALADWVARGADSPHALPPGEVVARSGPRDPDGARAAAHFALAQHLWRQGRADAAVPHFRAAHRLQPGNIAYKRQAWSLVPVGADAGPFERFLQGPVEGREEEWPYEGDWLSDVRAMGAENYYPPVDL
jgi:hypothetical protein